MSSLLSIFQQKLIPWAQEGLHQRLVIAQPLMKKSSVPSDVVLTPTKIPGKRVIVRNKREYGNQRVYCARWPEAGLQEMEVPKLVCILNGVMDLQAGKYVITCNQDHFIFVPPRTPHKFAAHSFQEGSEGFCAYFNIDLYRDSLYCMQHTRPENKMPLGRFARCIIHHPHTVEIFRRFVEELSSNQETDLDICADLLCAAFRSMSREIVLGHQLYADFHAPEHTKVPKSVQEIQDYIKTHLQDSLTIEKMAKAMYMSPSQFTHYIRKESGQSFGEMLTKCRISEAKWMLRDTQWSVATIARFLGLKSPTYFGELFFHHIGETPGAYRKKSQRQNFSGNRD